MEFRDLMREAHRMCTTLGGQGVPCVQCPVGQMCRFTFNQMSEERAKMLEEKVVKWANANPAPQPITWGEWISEISGSVVDGDLLGSPVPERIVRMFDVKDDNNA